MIKTQFTYYTSIKSFNGASPTIINHTPQSAEVFQNKYLLNELKNLDIYVKEYIQKRNNNEINEDIKLTNLQCFSKPSIRKSFIKTITYFHI